MGSGFIHGVDKSQIPTCSILGVDIAAIDMGWLLEFTRENIKALSGDYMCVANVHTTVTAFGDDAYRDIQNSGIMAIPDGGPLASLGQRRGHEGMARTAGPSYMEKILGMSAEKGWRHFFYGSTDETLGKMKATLAEKYAGVQIAGMYSPPFRELSGDEDRQITGMVNESSPDFVWVGLGAPKQERWMSAHQGKIKGLMVGVGAGFDYLAGNISRAPGWMQAHSLEWLYRLAQDPGRLLGRYVRTNTKFIWHALVKGK